jgi:hypothetical protein
MPVTRTPGAYGAAKLFTTATGDIAYIQAVTQADGSGNIISETAFQFACATGGIVNTADVAIAAAGAAGIRNYLQSLWFKNTAATASEIVIKDGSTVIWRGQVSASMTSGEFVRFDPPLRGTAATALNVALLTTATATIVSAQGYTGA